ncbi:MAG TPA: hypothetical protein VFA59_12755 [Vicinamibacterales bacterium]|nr:hypothetical protein [Vicinamibacterales bacterium]
MFFRHGEKPSSGNGQITCQGMNRALALPTVLFARYGKPAYLYAPNPGVKIADPGGSFNYIRPLATIEPTAVKLGGMPVNAKYSYSDVAGVEASLVTATKDNTVSFVSWEHAYLVEIAQAIMTAYGGGATVPAWVSGDYDSLYVVRLHWAADASGVMHPTATFTHEFEGLNGQPTSCPF